jgi:molybdopterin converting factor small subunit
MDFKRGENDFMEIIVRFRGPITRQLNDNMCFITVEENANICNAIQLLFEREKSVREIWDNVEKMDQEAMILVNEVDIGLTGGLDTILKQGDELVVLPLVHGG